MIVKKTSVSKKSTNIPVPTGVKIISILYLIGAIFLALDSIVLFFAGRFPGTRFFAIRGILVLAFAVLYFFISRALKNAKPWARIVVIVLSAISVLSALMSLFPEEFGSIKILAINLWIGRYPLLNLAINLWIGGYLLLNQKVKTFFGN